MPAKRSTERLGHPMYEKNAVQPEKKGRARKPIKIPPASPTWCPLAQGWYRSLALSGVSEFYETTDWALAYVAGDILDRCVEAGYPAGLTAEWSNMSARLLCTEGDRRRVKIELVKDGTDADEVAATDAVNEWDGKLKVAGKK